MIEIKHLTKSYGDLSILKDVNATIQKGDVISIIGPSGTGKSTLLRCLNLLERPTSGEILFNGVNLLDPRTDISTIRMKMGMVFQQFNLFPHLTVMENIISSPCILLKQNKKEAEKRAMELLDMVELDNKAYALPTELSGGQQQRVAIARALAMNPEVLLLDEPTSALDPTMVDEVLNVIMQLAKLGITMMTVTHEMRLAKDISTRIFYMDEGRIYEEGAPEQIFNAPRNLKTVKFVRRVDGFDFEISRDNVDFGHMRPKCKSLIEKYHVDMDNFEEHASVIKELIRTAIFPISEKVYVYVGYLKQADAMGCEIAWDGVPVNPLSEETKRMLDGAFEKWLFNVEDVDHPCIRFAFSQKKGERLNL